MPEQPANPTPAHNDLDSMLSRKFGKEVANYFSGSPLNRVGFLREDHKFLSQALQHPSTSFLVCNELQPLIDKAEKDKSPKKVGGHLKFIGFDDVKAVVGEDPYAGGEKTMVEQYDSRRYIPQMIFLGIDEKAKDGLEYQSKNLYKGAPYFAVDVTPKEGVKEACEKLIKDLEGRGLAFSQAPGGRVMDIDAQHAAIYAEARALLDWNARNPFCAACGQPTMSVNGGFKRICPPKDSSRPDDRPSCVTRKGISNLCFPRTDPTVIMAVVNSANTHLLLGRQRRWPPHWYSTLAGFAEPAESIEEAVRREVYEESGILVGRVVIHSTQPWPYPANLMIGAIGQAIPEGEKVDLGNDPELDDAKWVPFEEVRESLRVGTSGLGEDAGPEYKEGGLRLPPSTAIANQLMTAVCNGFVGGSAKM
ncbi:NADH pyrophosphatase [Vermiconidia calcicola]|uniref:NADH pyrophosphatase n=1 Tax=Vermiconidia calcicola TaxID=1690605 RepID=A0ACC3N0T7_9PEZI|nr:NADH pyrophosphatase [Vermiconidia calcicola]